MLAFSEDNAATPFIVLADGAYIKLHMDAALMLRLLKSNYGDPNAYLLNFLQSRSIVDCVKQMLRMVSERSLFTLAV